MMKCNNCQTENQDTSLVCTNCGVKLEENQQTTESNQGQQYQGQPQQQVQGQQYQGQPQQQNQGQQYQGQPQQQNQGQQYQGQPQQQNQGHQYQGQPQQQNQGQQYYQGQPQQHSYTEPPVVTQFNQVPYGATTNSTAYIIWSVANLILCCLPLGIIALVMVTNARNAITKEEYDKKIKTSLILNIIASVIGFIFATFVFFSSISA